jgi:hypothetical protein
MTHRPARPSKRLAAVLLFAALLPATPSAAQEMTLDQQVQFVRSITAAERQATLAKSVPLSAEESEQFWPLYREYRNEVAALDDRTLALIKEFADNFEALTDTKAKELTHEWFAIEKKRLEIKDKYAKRYEKVLPGVKLARMLQLENRLDVLVQLRLARNVPLVRN